MTTRHKDTSLNLLLSPLPLEERKVLKNLLTIYNTEDIGTQLLHTARSIDTLGTLILDGYPTAQGRKGLQHTQKKYRMWKKRLQKHISYLATPRGGRDRQAIALGCFRNFIMESDPETKWENLQECREQIVDLYTTLIDPFEF